MSTHHPSSTSHTRDPPPSHAQADAHDRVGWTVACMNCGYDVTGFALDGRCSECGTSVRSSCNADLFARECGRPTFVRLLVLWLVILGVLSALLCVAFLSLRHIN